MKKPATNPKTIHITIIPQYQQTKICSPAMSTFRKQFPASTQCEAAMCFSSDFSSSAAARRNACPAAGPHGTITVTQQSKPLISYYWITLGFRLASSYLQAYIVDGRHRQTMLETINHHFFAQFIILSPSLSYGRCIQNLKTRMK